jgi:hypothetical protein
MRWFGAFSMKPNVAYPAQNPMNAPLRDAAQKFC